MVIKYKRGGNFEEDFKDYFKDVEELKTFIGENNKFINVETLHNDISDIYVNLSRLDYSLKSSTLAWFVVKQFNFKRKRPNHIEFWSERGYGLKEFNEYNNCNIKEVGDSIKNIFVYGKFEYESEGEPKCNLCQSKLKIAQQLDKYKIVSCSNNSCASHQNSNITTIRQLAFLPRDIFEGKNNRINLKYKNTKEYWLLNGLSYSEAISKSKLVKRKLKDVNVNTFHYYKLLTDMTNDEINILIRSVSPLCQEYWLNLGLSELEAKSRISKLQVENSDKSVKCRLESPDEYTATTVTQLGYWVNKGYSEDEAKIKVSERQTTFSKEICIEKYGEVEGLKVFTDRQKKWGDSLTSGGNLKVGYSRISQELFYNLLDNYSIDERNDILFATYNKEFRLDKINGGVWLYDFTNTKHKKMIEYHGDMYHGNPKKYVAEDYPHPFRKGITAQGMWDKDKLKSDVALVNGYELLVIWDSEYRWGNKQEVINKCIKFLNN